MTRTENFIIDFEGQEYRCQNNINEGPVFTQEIFVENLGSKEDSHPYESGQIDSMAAAARRIAREIIEETQLVEEPLNQDV